MESSPVQTHELQLRDSSGLCKRELKENGALRSKNPLSGSIFMHFPVLKKTSLRKATVAYTQTHSGLKTHSGATTESILRVASEFERERNV
eukprot:2927918-Amphidinium_carterae.1